MRAVIQRVRRAKVTVKGSISGEIGPGLLVLLGIEEDDCSSDIEWLAGKISRLRIFDDAEGVMNMDVNDIAGEILVVSQFTLFASTRKGNRPAYSRASKGEIAVKLYIEFIEEITKLMGSTPQTGSFGAMMEVELLNDGPVTIIIDTKQKE